MAIGLYGFSLLIENRVLPRLRFRTQTFLAFIMPTVSFEQYFQGQYLCFSSLVGLANLRQWWNAWVSVASEQFCSDMIQRRQDICGRTTSIRQFSSEMQQTWHKYFPRSQEQLLLQSFFYRFQLWTAHFRWISPIFAILNKVSKDPQP
jgi:hypothetical protein